MTQNSGDVHTFSAKLKLNCYFYSLALRSISPSLSLSHTHSITNTTTKAYKNLVRCSIQTLPIVEPRCPFDSPKLHPLGSFNQICWRCRHLGKSAGEQIKVRRVAEKGVGSLKFMSTMKTTLKWEGDNTARKNFWFKTLFWNHLSWSFLVLCT